MTLLCISFSYSISSLAFLISLSNLFSRSWISFGVPIRRSSLSRVGIYKNGWLSSFKGKNFLLSLNSALWFCFLSLSRLF